MPSAKISDADLKYLYGWRFGTALIKGELVEFNTLISNIVTGTVDSGNTHHCPICNKATTKSCFHEPHLAYCCAVQEEVRNIDGKQVDRSECGMRFVPRGIGCSKHKYHNGHNLFFRQAWKDQPYELPSDLPHVPQPTEEEMKDTQAMTPQPEKPAVILTTGLRSIKRPKTSKKGFDDDTPVERKPRTKKVKEIDEEAATSPESIQVAENDEDIPEEAKEYIRNNPGSKVPWYETYRDFEEPPVYPEKKPSAKVATAKGKLQPAKFLKKR